MASIEDDEETSPSSTLFGAESEQANRASIPVIRRNADILVFIAGIPWVV
jgi:hypothetical protein